MCRQRRPQGARQAGPAVPVVRLDRGDDGLRRRDVNSGTFSAGCRRDRARGAHPLASSLLLVEDNEVNQLVASEILTVAGCDLVVADNGAEALHAVHVRPFDIVLMDCQMPEMDGFEATRRIRRLEAEGLLPGATHRLGIIALTANAIRGDRERCLEAGADAYLTKPIVPALLIQTVKNLAASREPLPPARLVSAAKAATPAASQAVPPIDLAASGGRAACTTCSSSSA